MFNISPRVSQRSIAWILFLSLAISVSSIAFIKSVLKKQPVKLVECASAPQIRVLLSRDPKKYKVTFANGCRVSYFDERKYNGKHTFFVTLSNKTILLDGKDVGKKLTITPSAGSTFSLGVLSYQGKITFEANKDRLYAINTLDTESYLAGVIPSEMPAHWEMQALMSQAIAARTYSLFIKERFGKNRSWDIRSSQANQVYRGINAQHLRSSLAVRDTQGLILSDPKSKQVNGLFPAYYCAVCGGHTENSKYVFGDDYACLQGVKCPYCEKTANKKFLDWPKYSISKKKAFEKLLRKYPNLSKLKALSKIIPIRTSKYGNLTRITRFEILGTNGKKDIVGGEDLRLTLDPTGQKIKSAATKVVLSRNKVIFKDGRGFGHGVGLCQYGALEMARKKYKYTDILNYYYPGSQIKRIY